MVSLGEILSSEVISSEFSLMLSMLLDLFVVEAGSVVEEGPVVEEEIPGTRKAPGMLGEGVGALEEREAPLMLVVAALEEPFRLAMEAEFEV